ncbi:MAG: tetratricopeptide repeat protein [Pseudomonadota bacterium]
MDLFPKPNVETSYLIPIAEALDAGEFQRAEVLLRARLDDAPEDSIAWEALGVTLALMGDVDGADDAYSRAIEIEPLRLSARVKQGDLAEASGDLPGAIAHWKKAFDVNPVYRPANERLGRAYSETGNVTLAIQHFEAAAVLEEADDLGVKPDLALLYNQTGRADDTLRMLAPWDGEDADVVPSALFALGNAYVQTGDQQAARVRYERALDEVPDNAGITRAYGALLVDMGQPDLAVEVLKDIAAAEPADAFANLTLARALAILARHADAAASAERAATAAGATAVANDALSLAARSHLFNRDFPAATDASAQLVSLFPDAVTAWREHAAIVAATGQYEAAQQVYGEGLERFQDDAQLLRGRSIVHIRMEEFDAAAEDAMRAAEIAPNWFEPHFLLGEIARAQGQNTEAEAAYASALEINPGHWPSMINLAVIARDTGRLDAAQELAERAVAASNGASAAQALLDEINQRVADQ